MYQLFFCPPAAADFSIGKNNRSSAPNVRNLRRQRSSMTMAAMFALADSGYAATKAYRRVVPQGDKVHRSKMAHYSIVSFARPNASTYG
jgi:hypothetical protein